VSALVLEGVEHPPLRLGTRRFEPGLHVIRTLDSLAHGPLLALLSGADAPKRGRVLVGERRPYDDRAARAQIGTLWPEERFTLGRTFREGLERLGASPARKRNALEFLAALSSPLLADRSTQGLTPKDHRLLALTMALTTEHPLALVLHEPSKSLDPEPQSLVLERILAHGDAIPILVFTASATLANSLGGSTYELDAGLLRANVAHANLAHANLAHANLAHANLAAPSPQTQMRIRGVGLRALVAELARNKAVTRLELGSAVDGTEFVSLATTDPRPVSLAVTRIAVDTGMRVLSLESWELPQ
jgi:ABC-type branched-subunit amino acid transport system ATPase component